MKAAREVAEWAAQAIVLIWATSMVAMPCVIPSGSMESTLMTGDHVIVDRLAYASPSTTTAKLLPYEDVQRGDIVVFRYPIDIRQNYVKRVVGIPGDRVHLSNGVLYRNGARVNEAYTQFVQAPPDEYRDNFPADSTPLRFAEGNEMLRNNVEDRELIVPAGNYFVMGDNRNNSDDSRYWGFVPRANIIGKPVLVFWSYDAPTEDLLDFNLHHVVDLAEHFFTKTRWNRTMRVVRPS